MKLLAVDTSTNSCSVALLDDRRLLAEIVYTDGKTHSRHLMSMIDQVLGCCGHEPGAIEGIGVTVGPGTFTGLRIGIGTIKGLCAAIKAPVVGISSLAALAAPLTVTGRAVVSVIDARRHEVYWQLFKENGKEPEPVGDPFVGPPETVAESLPETPLLVGSGAVLYRSVFERLCPGLRVAADAHHDIRASVVGLLALHRFERHKTDQIETLTPNYIRKSDAQIHSSGTC